MIDLPDLFIISLVLCLIGFVLVFVSNWISISLREMTFRNLTGERSYQSLDHAIQNAYHNYIHAWDEDSEKHWKAEKTRLEDVKEKWDAYKAGNVGKEVFA